MDWKRIRQAYLTEPGATYKALAERFGVPVATLAARVQREGWAKERRRLRADQRADQHRRVAFVTDRLLTMMEKAVEELDVQTVKRTKRVKEIEYNNAQRPDKPTREMIVDDEELVAREAPVDRAGLKQMTSALKDLKEVLRAELDVREQEARIAKLEQQLNEVEDDEIRLEPEAEEFAV